MDTKEIHELIKLIHKTNLAEFKLKEGEFELTIRTESFNKGRQDAAVPMPQAPPAVTHAPAVAGPPPVMPATQPAPVEPVAAPKEVSASNLIEVKSPMVGTFYRASSPDKAPFVQVGDVIRKGDVVCIIEAMKLFNEIESEVSGKVVKMMVDDATPVEYDQVLFLVDPAG